MAVELFVTLHKGQWQVVYVGQVFGPYATKGHALRAAVRAISAGSVSASRALAEAACGSPEAEADGDAVRVLVGAKAN
jgi:hypothetical protein